MDLNELVTLIKPEQTSLLLGAGASVPSGAPSGVQLAHSLANRANPPIDGDELDEVAGIFLNRLGRAALVAAVREELKGLTPTGGLLGIATFKWRAIFSTNFDSLVEEAYRQGRVPLDVVRSNYDFSKDRDSSRTTLFKIHGCISQDIADGNNARLVLTESDYDDVGRYRQALFASLEANMHTSDTLIIGQSLRDRHLRDLAKKVASLSGEGIPGRVFLLSYEEDEARADLFEQRGIRVAFGSLDDFVHAMASTAPTSNTPAYSTASTDVAWLAPRLATSTLAVAHSVTLTPNATALFEGSAATYADIANGLTIQRTVTKRLAELQDSAKGYFVTLSGAGGVGKTTAVRELLVRRHGEQFLCWEHLNDFTLDVDGWIEKEAELRRANRQGILFVDDAPATMAEVNRLVDRLGSIERPYLRVVLTATTPQWSSRAKSRYFFSRGSIERLSRLTETDIDQLVNLVDRESSISDLVSPSFKQLGRSERVKRLRDRCNADMFVCLKNIFATEALDQILLQEFALLGPEEQDVYRTVAALQAMGSRVHRQLVVRLLGIDAGILSSLLQRMDEVVTEYPIDERYGLYGWTTRHDVIADVIATYKFADQEELYALLARLIDGLNPVLELEKTTANSIASDGMGIARLTDRERQISLLQKLIEVVPGMRTPRRRLIRLYLETGRLPEARTAIELAQSALKGDGVVERYRARLAQLRAEQTPGLMNEDRIAMLREASSIADNCITKNPADRYNYRTLAEIGIAIANRGSDITALDAAIERMNAADELILDPDFTKERLRYEARRRSLDLN